MNTRQRVGEDTSAVISWSRVKSDAKFNYCLSLCKRITQPQELDQNSKLVQMSNKIYLHNYNNIFEKLCAFRKLISTIEYE